MHKLSKRSWITTALILLAGFVFLYFEIVDYGSTFFMLFPLAVGFSVGTHEKDQRNSISIAFGVIVFLGFLLAGALEGLICVLMALPIFLFMAWLGSKIRKHTIAREEEQSDVGKMMITLMPLVLLLAVNPIEEMILPEPKVITIENAVLLDYAPETVFNEVKQMDKLDAEKPFGLLLGLPSPYRCELAADTVGAIRTCLFSNGEIIAQITKYEPGKVLEMDVVDYTLTGRDWFEFVDATYTFKEENGQTKITRTSSYKSILNPRFYWQPLESWGIAQEHKFVLASLKKNLKEKYGN